MFKNRIHQIIFLVSLVMAPLIIFIIMRCHSGVAAHWIHQISPGCLFYDWTGIKCPGCGGTRAMSFLVRGEWGKALSMNAFWAPTFIILLVEYIQAWLRFFNTTGRFPVWSVFRLYAIRSYGIILLVFVVARNLFDF